MRNFVLISENVFLLIKFQKCVIGISQPFFQVKIINTVFRYNQHYFDEF